MAQCTCGAGYDAAYGGSVNQAWCRVYLPDDVPNNDHYKGPYHVPLPINPNIEIKLDRIMALLEEQNAPTIDAIADPLDHLQAECVGLFDTVLDAFFKRVDSEYEGSVIDTCAAALNLTNDEMRAIAARAGWTE